MAVPGCMKSRSPGRPRPAQRGAAAARPGGASGAVSGFPGRSGAARPGLCGWPWCPLGPVGTGGFVRTPASAGFSPPRRWLQAPGGASLAWPAASSGAQRLEMGTLARCRPAGELVGLSVFSHIPEESLCTIL